MKRWGRLLSRESKRSVTRVRHATKKNRTDPAYEAYLAIVDDTAAACDKAKVPRRYTAAK